MACNDCTPQPCLDCTGTELALNNLCQEGCEKYVPTECTIYSGEDIDIGDIHIHKGDNLNLVISNLIKEVDIDIDLQWNNTTRVLSLLKNDTVVASETITDRDDQYLVLSSNKLSIYKPRFTGNPSDDIKINEVDLSTLFTETTLSISSTSLSVTAGGTRGHTPTINIVPSTDDDNAFELGTDGRPYVAIANTGTQNVIIEDIDGLSWTKTTVNGVITFTPEFDWDYIASQVCPLCAPSCAAPTNLNATTI